MLSGCRVAGFEYIITDILTLLRNRQSHARRASTRDMARCVASRLKRTLMNSIHISPRSSGNRQRRQRAHVHARTVARFRFLLSRGVAKNARHFHGAMRVRAAVAAKRYSLHIRFRVRRREEGEREYSRAVAEKRGPSFSLSLFLEALSSEPDIDLHDSSARARARNPSNVTIV